MFLILLAGHGLSLSVNNFLKGVQYISDDLPVGFAVCNREPVIYKPIDASKSKCPDYTFKGITNITKALYDYMPMITTQTRIVLFSDGHFNETGFEKIINRAYAVAVGSDYNYRNLLNFTKSKRRIFMPWDAAFLAGVIV